MLTRCLSAIALVPLVVVAGAAAAPRTQPLSQSFCSKLFSGGRASPDYVIASDDALKLGREANAMVAAVKFVLKQKGYRAGRYTVGYQSCDDSTPQSPNGDLAKCASNAKAYAADPDLVGVIGTWFSGCTRVALPVIESSPSGPLALISSNNTSPGLTHASAGSLPGEPERLYPSSVRNFVRLEAPDDFQGLAAAALASQLHRTRAFVLDDAEPYARDVEGGFREAAHNLGVGVAGSASWTGAQGHFAPLMRQVARAHPTVVLLAGSACPTCGSLLKALRKAAPSAVVIAPDAFSPVSAVVELAGAAAEGIYLLEAGIAPSRYGAQGQELQRRFGRARTEAGGAPAAAQAAEILLDAIAASDGTRASVTAHLMSSSVKHGILGSFAFDANGDMSPGPVSVFRVRHGRQMFDRLVYVSSKLRG